MAEQTSSEMKGWQKLLCRASVVAGITFLSMMIYKGYPPTMEALYIAALNFGLSFLFFINTVFEKGGDEGDKKKSGKMPKKQAILKQLNKIDRNESKKILSFIPNLWFP